MRQFSSGFLLAVLLTAGLVAQESQVQTALFRQLAGEFDQAKKQEVYLFAPESYALARALYQEAEKAYEKGEKIADIQRKVDASRQALQQATRAAETARPLVQELVNTRRQIARFNYQQAAPEEMAKSERYFRSALNAAEKRDHAGVEDATDKTLQQYRLATLKWLEKVVVLKAEKSIRAGGKTVNPAAQRRSLSNLKSVRNLLNLGRKQAFNVFEYRKDMLDKIQDVLSPLYPPFYRNLPDTLLIGDFELLVSVYTDKGMWDFSGGKAVGLSGIAWSSFHCPFRAIIQVFPAGFLKVVENFQVVQVVTNPQTQISLEEAKLVKPEIHIGQTLPLELAVEKNTFQDIVRAKLDLIDRYKLPKRGDFKLQFKSVTIEPVAGRDNVGRITAGTAVYPTPSPEPAVLRIYTEGFGGRIDSLVLSPAKAEADLTLELPTTIAAGSACKPASVYLGRTTITNTCEFYVEKLTDNYGPFWIGNTDIEVKGKGFVADFSATKTYTGTTPMMINTWKGLLLLNGESLPATAAVYSNSGYRKAHYAYTLASVTAAGFNATLKLQDAFSFYPTQPFGYKVAFQQGELSLSKNQVNGGEFRQCGIELPQPAVTDASFGQIKVTADTLKVQTDGDLFGKVKFNNPIFWGELTGTSDKLFAYSAEDAQRGHFFLSARQRAPYWPVSGGTFQPPALYPAEKQLDSLGIQGVTLQFFRGFHIYTPDTPGSTPLDFGPGTLGFSWINVVSRGVHGSFSVVEFPRDSLQLGPTYQPFYVAKTPYTTILGSRKEHLKIAFANSAVHDAAMRGAMHLKGPSKILLDFKDMAFTSTAHNAGGQVDLSTPDTLDYWGVVAVQRPGFSSAGLICVKTGQIILTAAGLEEKRHFSQPFYLTWGEMLADGNLGRLFFDYNTAGQTFDGFNFTASAVRLSDYDPKKPGYLQAGGTAHFDFFGADYLNLYDYKYTKTVAPYNGRKIMLGFDHAKGFFPADTTISRNWSGNFGTMNFNIAYDSTDQDGFKGTGKMGLGFIENGQMAASIVLSSKRICMSIWETSRHDFTLGPVSHFGSMSSIWGCACIEQGQLKRLMLGAELETTGNANILLRSAAYGKLEYLVTPSVSELTINGNMYISILVGGDLEVTGKARFKVDRAQAYVDGDLYGKFNTSSVMGGITAEGQVNWHIGTVGSEGYMSLQGKIGVAVVALIGPSGSLEGGFYVGINAPKNKAWILQDEHSRFRLNISALPDNLTGVYGYVKASSGFNFFLFSGGIETYTGLGGFVLTAAQANALQVVASGFVGLPYAIGHLGLHIHGEILGGLVSAGAWANLGVIGPYPFSFEGTVGLEGCVVWVVCGSVDLTVGLNSSDGFYIE